jgi:hypothetical protein
MSDLGIEVVQSKKTNYLEATSHSGPLPFLKVAVPDIGCETIPSATDVGGITGARHIALVLIDVNSVQLGDVGLVAAVYGERMSAPVASLEKDTRTALIAVL